MDAVEIAHGDHGPAGDLGGRGGVSNNGKTSGHFGVLYGFFRDFSEILGSRRGRTVTRWPHRSQAGRVGPKRLQSAAVRLTGCLTAGARGWGEDCGSRRPVEYLWRKH